MIRSAKIALSAAAILGSATAAFAIDVPEARVSGFQAPSTMTAVRHVGSFSTNGYEVPEIRVSGAQTPVAMTMVRHFGSFSTNGYDVPEIRVSGVQMNATMAKAKVATFRFVAAANQSTVDVPENRIGDRYPGLAHVNSPVAAKHASVVAYEVPEYRIGDRYPALEPTVARHAVSRTAISTPVAYEVPEDRIGDKYPLLAQSGTQGGMKTFASTGRFHKQAQKLTTKNKV